MMLTATARSAAIGSMLAFGACAEARETGREIVWESERVESSTTMQTAAADGCREYTQTIRIDGQEQQAFGRACPQPDGSWRIYAPPAPQQSLPAPITRAVPVYPAYPAYPYYYSPPVFFGSAFHFSNRHHHHRHHHHHQHRHSRHGHRR